MMGEHGIKTDRPLAPDTEAVENLIEDIRLLSLNISIAASKLKINGDSRVIIRRKVSELVELALDTVNQLVKMLRILKSGSESTEPEANLSELMEIEKNIQHRAEEIMRLLSKSEKDVSE